ncbi:MAG: HAMP domain-containing histidine kinase [Planctomycetales bacterium]|nr:HAMP domain-containing histidine kinase [Planctomycetales bacterium]
MAYRSFKRVLVETSLERRCLAWFGIALTIIIAGSFWAAERIAERLVTERTQQAGEDYVGLKLYSYHYAALSTSQAISEHEFGQINEMSNELLIQNLEWEILVVDDKKTIDKSGKTRLPQDDHERWVMNKMQQRLEDELANVTADVVPQPLESDPPVGGTPEEVGGSLAGPIDRTPDYRDQLKAINRLEKPKDGDDYTYYQVIYWRNSCISCHEAEGVDRVRFAHEDVLPELRGDLRVAKVTIPSESTQNAILFSRGVLAATAIVTVAAGMIALYFVVHYIIIRPLKHLRDVSDEVSRGNTNLRADIQTNDEFEELSVSFNRMLRHLVEAQEELRSVNADLDAKVDELAQVNMQLHEMNRVKSDFLANMSHELRTPLNSIIGFSDVLRKIKSLEGKQKRYVENIGNSGRMLRDMINDILDLAKIDSGKMELKLSQFEIEKVVAAQCDLVRALAEEKNIDLSVHVEPDLPLMTQDQIKIQQILTNLLSNAIKFTPEGGRISVTAKRTVEDQLELSVEDTGVGIAEEDRQVIFEKFRQGTVVLGENNLTREFSGTGLGLSIVKELSILLGGETSFESELGKGSCFTVRIPWRSEEQPRVTSSITARLNEITKPTRFDFPKHHSSLPTNRSLTEPNGPSEN